MKSARVVMAMNNNNKEFLKVRVVTLYNSSSTDKENY